MKRTIRNLKRDKLNKIVAKSVRTVLKEYLVYKRYAFASTLQDEELTEGVTYLTTKETGLSRDIIVDCGKTYIYYHHPICLYIVNGNNVIPVIISRKPFANPTESVPLDIIVFITDNHKLLQQFANMEIDGGDFFTELKKIKSRTTTSLPITEMSNYGPNKTGLPIWVYVDDTGSYLNSGHNRSYRIKFQQDKDIKNPRQWMPITIPGLEVIDKDNIPKCKISQKEINLVIQWATKNMALLLKLKNQEISGTEFLESMKTMKALRVTTDN